MAVREHYENAPELYLEVGNNEKYPRHQTYILFILHLQTSHKLHICLRQPHVQSQQRKDLIRNISRPDSPLPLPHLTPVNNSDTLTHPHDTSGQAFTSPIPLFPIDWFPSLSPQACASARQPEPPSAIQPEPPSIQQSGPTLAPRGRNRRGGRGGKSERSGQNRKKNGGERGRESTPDDPSGVQKDTTSQTTRRKGQSSGMNHQDKLVLICECCEHANEYNPRNKTGFWDMIHDLLKEQTGYDFWSQELRSRVGSRLVLMS